MQPNATALFTDVLPLLRQSVAQQEFPFEASTVVTPELHVASEVLPCWSLLAQLPIDEHKVAALVTNEQVDVRCKFWVSRRVLPAHRNLAAQQFALHELAAPLAPVRFAQLANIVDGFVNVALARIA